MLNVYDRFFFFYLAVVVDYKTVFIIFGITEKLTEATLSILMLNVRDPLNITLNETYEKRNETTTVNNNEVKSSSQGKMIGIAVGVTAAVSNISSWDKYRYINIDA